MAARETTPAEAEGDSVDDPAIWVDPADPSRSVVIGANHLEKTLEVYDLSGARLQGVTVPSANNVDGRTGFPLGGTEVALFGTGSAPARPTGSVSTTAPRAPSTPSRSAGAGRSSSGSSSTTGARSTAGWPGPSTWTRPRWKYGAEPDAAAGPQDQTLVDTADGRGQLVADVEGLAVLDVPGGDGFLLASSQGDYTFNVNTDPDANQNFKYVPLEQVVPLDPG